jgi:hypothetical protein
MSRYALAALAMMASLAGCNGVILSGPSATPGRSGYGEQTLATDPVGGDFGVGAGNWAASGLAGGSLYLVNRTGGGQ